MSQGAMAEPSAQHPGPVAGLPPSVRSRQAWRPPALRRTESLLVGVAARTAPFFDRAASLADWQERLANRAQPWAGWSPLAVPAEQAGSESPTRRFAAPPGNDQRRLVIERATPAAAPLLAPSQRPGSESGSGGPLERRSGTPGQPAATIPRPGPARQSVSVLPPARPRVRLAIQRSPTPSERQAGDQQGSSPIVLPSLDDHVVQQPRQGAELLAPRFGPVLSISPSPRRELPGGFPERRAADGVGSQFIAPAPRFVAPSRSPERRAADNPMVGAQFIAPAPSSPSPAPSPAGAPWHTPTSVQRASPDDAGLPSGGLIERLIERTVLPTPLPGFELRLRSPQERPAVEPPADGPPRPSEEQRTGGPPPTQPRLDLDAVAERVYQTLERRQRLERERRGLPPWR
jgi:hypothetical protein